MYKRCADEEEIKNLDVIVLAVPHRELLDKFTLDEIDKLYRSDKKVLVDIKSVLDRKECEARGYSYWSL